jgi:hypothetical protein
VSGDRRELFDALAQLQLSGSDASGNEAAADETAAISVPVLVARWLARGPAIFAGDDRDDLDALCRQVDVRKKVSAGYGPGWKRLDPEVPAVPPVVSGVVAVLLGNAAGVGAPGPDGARNDGWGLKCTNSALKALELHEHLPHASELRVWAIDVLDRMRDIPEPR